MIATVAETAKSAEIADIDKNAEIDKVAEISGIPKTYKSGTKKKLVTAFKNRCNLKNWNDFLL